MAQAALQHGSSEDAEGWLVEARDQIALHGGLPNLFSAPGPNGRLHPLADGPVHALALQRQARKLLLRDTGWSDYDLSSAHLSIFISLGKAHGFETTATEAYRADKTASHDRWAALIEHDTPDDFKTLILSFLNGGALHPSKYTAAGSVFGASKVHRIRHELPEVVSLAQEIRAGMKQVVERYLFGPLGELSPHAISYSQRGSFILTVFEQFAIREICARLPAHTLRTVIYDGWISSEPLSEAALRDLEAHVRARSLAVFRVPLDIGITATAFAKGSGDLRLLA
jgi:hypothetical protein